jgi:hypothetical protein
MMAIGTEFWVRTLVLLGFVLATVLASATPPEETPVDEEDVLHALSFWC